MDTLRKVRALALSTMAGLFVFTGTAQAAMIVVEDFNDTSLHAGLQDPANAYFQTETDIVNISNTRKNIITGDSDYNTVDFQLDLDVSLSGTDIAFIGFGEGTPHGFWQEPLGSFFRIHTSNLVGGRVDVAVDTPQTPGFEQVQTIGNIGGNGSHRARISKTGNLLSFQLDQFFNGVFGADGGHVIDLSSLPYDASNSRLFFGSQRSTVRFDNFNLQINSVPAAVAEPNVGVLMAFGICSLLLLKRRSRRA
ncbi:MAG: hypothetical protein AAF529_18980 [Pseudomonadota bacterium]